MALDPNHHLLHVLVALGVAACGGTEIERPTVEARRGSDPPPAANAPATGDAELRPCEARRDEPPLDLAIAVGILESGDPDGRLTPPLPIDWPPTDDRLQYFVYSSRALPTGIVAYEIREPSTRIILTSIPRTMVQEPLAASPSVLGRRRGMDTSEDDREAFARAQQALLDVATRRRCPEDVREELGAYCAWLGMHDPISTWVVAHQQSFVDWLGCDGAAQP